MRVKFEATIFPAHRAHLFAQRRQLHRRFPRIVDAVQKLRVKSVLLDGEGPHGKQNDEAAQQIAFDLLEIDGDDLRSSPLIDRKKRLARLLIKLKEGSDRRPLHNHVDGIASMDLFVVPTIIAKGGASLT
jgi:ATP-dependent DNA ligase